MTEIFQLSDLSRRPKSVLERAAGGEALIRGKDGASLVMTSESRVRNLEKYRDWSIRLMQLRSFLDSENTPGIPQWGELAWLRVFDEDDLRTFISEAESQLLMSDALGDYSEFDELVDEWKVTAGQLEDPLRRHILLSRGIDDDAFIEARRPTAERGEETGVAHG